MAAGTSIFLPVMEYNGDTWHLQYDPENPMSVRCRHPPDVPSSAHEAVPLVSLSHSHFLPLFL